MTNIRMTPRRWFIMCVLTMLCLLCFGRAEKVEAASFKPPEICFLDSTSNYKKHGVTIQELLDNYDLDVAKVKSSNSKVLAVKKSNRYYNVYPKKTGTATLNVTLNDESSASGKVTVTTKVKVKTYKNPLKVFKVGTTNFTKRFSKDRTAQYNPAKERKVKGKLTVKPISGWKLVKIIRYNYFKSKSSVLKNGKTYTFSSDRDRIIVAVKEKKSGYIRVITLNELG